MTEGRVTPFYCPYCAEEDLIPQEQPAGAWKCLACLRVFSVQFVGLALSGNAAGNDSNEGDVGETSCFLAFG